jgi:hypothetical protein
MNAPDGLDRRGGDLLAALYAAEAVGSLERRMAAERDVRYRARYAALTGHHLPMPRPSAIALGYARVAAEYRRRYGVADPVPDADTMPSDFPGWP